MAAAVSEKKDFAINAGEPIKVAPNSATTIATSAMQVLAERTNLLPPEALADGQVTVPPFLLIRGKPVEKLDFTDDEKKLICGMFNKLALYDSFSFMDLLGFYLCHLIEELQLPSSEPLLNDAAAAFLFYHTGLYAKTLSKDLPADKYAVVSCSEFIGNKTTFQNAIHRLQGIFNKQNAAYRRKIERSGISTGLELALKLSNHPTVLTDFIDISVRAFHDSRSLKKEDPELTLKHLLKYILYHERGIDTLNKSQKIGFSPSFLQGIKHAITNCIKDGFSLNDIYALEKILNDLFISAYEQAQKQKELVAQGFTKYGEGEKKTRYLSEKRQQEAFSERQDLFLKDLQQTIEYQVARPRFSETYHSPTDRVTDLFPTFLAYLNGLSNSNLFYTQRLPSPNFEQLSITQESLSAHVDCLLPIPFSKCDPSAIYNFSTLVTEVQTHEGLSSWGRTLYVLKGLTPALNEKQVLAKAAEKTLKILLVDAKTQLSTCPQKEKEAKAASLKVLIRTSCTQLLHLGHILTTMQLLLKVDVAVAEKVYFSEKMTALYDLEAIDALMTPKPAKSKKEKAERKERQPAKDESFEAHRGDSTRKLVKDVKTFGFVEVRRRGSHASLKHFLGGGITIPMHKDQKRGTLESIIEAVNKILASHTS